MSKIIQCKPDYTVAGVASLYQCSLPTIYSLIRSGALRAYKLGRSTRITRESVENLRKGGAE